MGVGIIIQAFIVVIIGGFGHYKGVIAGSLLIGFLQSYAATFAPAYTDISMFVIVILVLLVKPEGFFGTVYQEAH
jgi:branched-subunit amino acid ABC-type transport system permease component